MTAATNNTFATPSSSFSSAQGETSAANKHRQIPGDVMTMSTIVRKETIAYEDDEIDDFGMLKMNSSARTASPTKEQPLHVGGTFDMPVSWGADSETSFSMEDSFCYADANSSNVSLDFNDINDASVDHSSIDITTRTPPSRSTSSSTHRRSVSSQGSGRRCPKRGLSASCSSLNFDLSNLVACEGQALSREKSKLNKLSNRSNESGVGVGDSSGKRDSSFCSSPRRAVPPRSGSSGSIRRTMQRPNSLEGNMFSQLQVGDMVLLANKELNTSSHLKRRMPLKRSTAHAITNSVVFSEQFPTSH